MAQVRVESALHEYAAGDYEALGVLHAVVGLVYLVQTVALVGVETLEVYARHVVSDEVLQLIGVEHSLLLVGADIHQ